MPIIVYGTDPEAIRRRGMPFILWGALAIALGVAVLLWPSLTGEVLVRLLGVLTVVAGVVLVISALWLRKATGGWWWVSTVPGVLLVGFGLLTALAPGVVSTFFFVFFAVLVVFWGIGDIVLALRVREAFSAWWVRLLRGVLLVAAGMYAILTPVSGLVAVGWLIGAWCVLIGALSIWFGLVALRA